MNKKIPVTFVVLVLLFLGTGVVTASDDPCTETGFYRDGINMTAKLIEPSNVTGAVDATGCNIGVYYGPGSSGEVKNAEIFGANYFGVVNRQGNVTVANSEIHDIGETPFNGAQHGVAVYYATVDTSSPAGQCTGGTTGGTIKGNTVYDYQKGGIVASCSGTKVEVRNNTVTGLDSVPYIAQNGIQFGYGATGAAMGNTVDGNWYTGANWSSTGILIFETSHVVVQKNILEDNQVGVGIESWCWFVASANNNKVVQNTITGSDWGVSVGAVDWLYSTCNPSADNNKVVNNVITASDGEEGVSIWVYDDGPYTPSANNNKAINNEISGYDTPVGDGGTNTKVHANGP